MVLNKQGSWNFKENSQLNHSKHASDHWDQANFVMFNVQPTPLVSIPRGYMVMWRCLEQQKNDNDE